MTEKICTRCGKGKSLCEFSKRRSSGDALRPACKECSNIQAKEWRTKNDSHVKEYDRNYKKENKLRMSQYSRKWKLSHPERAQAHVNKWKANNPDKVRVLNKRNDEKRRSTPRGKLNDRISSGIRMSLSKGKAGRHWEKLVGYTAEQLKKHIEGQFLPGMEWGNCREWHIDHKIPIAAFNFTTPEDIDFKRCWALKNLQPMWARENISKGTRIDRPFQPSLTI